MPETGYSMVKTYRRCPKSYEYKYIQQLQRKRPPAPLIRGTILHALLDARATKRATAPVLARYEEEYGRLFREEQDLYGEDFLGDIKRIWKGYERTYQNEEITYESSEEFVATDIGPNLRYTGHIDKRLITNKDGRRWIMDHKTHKSFPTEEQRLPDYQILMYVWAYNRERPSKPVEGIIWDYIRTKPPTIPDRLKNGELSQAKNIDTDVQTYTRELARHGLDPKPYRGFIAELEKRSKNRFYQRIFLPAPPKTMTEKVVEDFRRTSVLMTELKIYPRTMTKDCSWCEYYRLCSAELRGLDANYVRKAEYEERPPGEATAEEN